MKNTRNTRSFFTCIIVLLLLFTVPCSMVSALDGVFFGAGAEAGGNAREGAAPGVIVLAGAEINQLFALGFRKGFFLDTAKVTTLEDSVFFRVKFPVKNTVPFVQAELGTSVLFEDGKSYPLFLGALAAGWRFHIGRFVYIEPAARVGHPFIWGAGLAIGIRFDKEEGVR